MIKGQQERNTLLGDVWRTMFVWLWKHCDKHGSITFTESGSIKTGVFPVNPLKPTGAGDAFMGGFINGMASGKSIEESVYQASACAAIVVTKVGCAPAMPNFKELNEFLKSNSIEKPDEVLKNAYSTIWK